MMKMKKSNKLTIGILAHVDAGKTTLSEGILYLNGITRSLGRVDHGDAFLDTFELERARGITIFSKQAVFPLEQKEVTLLDTPGHMDFSAEMERVLQVLDYAILVISGPDGIQGQVQTLWKLLERYEIPTFLFINKMDQEGADLSYIMVELRNRLSEHCILADKKDESFFEQAALCDEALLEKYLETGIVTDEEIAHQTAKRRLFPCFSGSALKMQGVQEFLDEFGKLTLCPSYSEAFSARVFKITRDEHGNRLTHLKITGGVLRVKDLVGEDKVNQIRIYSGARFQSIEKAEAGTICAVTGLANTHIGQGLGASEGGFDPLLDTVITYQVLLPEGYDQHSAYMKLKLLEEEIPELHVVWNETKRQIHIQMMGEVQGEILKKLVAERFDMQIDYGSETIIYKETIADMVEGVGHFEPLRHYAEVHLLLEPLPPGSGMVTTASCSEDVLDRNWQRLILSHLTEKPHLGVLTGSEITDIKITLAAGKAHVKHTEGGDFRQATYRAVRQGLRKAKSILLEPYYEYRLEIPQELVGRAMSDVQKMYGTCNPPESFGETTVLTGDAPVATMNGYQKEVVSYTKGVGRLFCFLKGYFPCHNAEEVIAAAKYDADRDLENPCGSVFCSHGSGVVVPWNEVEQHMHLSSALESPKELADSDGNSGAASGSRRYSDEELEAVFRMTYGISKRDQSKFKKSARVVKPLEMTAGPRVKNAFSDSKTESCLLIDGYNIIFAWEELKEMSKLNLESARSLLIEVLQNYQGYTNEKILLIFDAYKQPGNNGSTESYGDLRVIYTKEGQTADQYIEKFVLENIKKIRITVATSDGLEQMMVFGQGALRMPARELQARILAINEEMRQKYLGK